jgi:hypothetical protein
VNQHRSNRAILPRGSPLFLCLALFVFAWGLQYKLSLYDAPQSESRSIPAAKLLSKNERASVSKNVLLRSTDASRRVRRSGLTQIYVLFIQTLGLCIALARRPRLRLPEGSIAPSTYSGLTAFFFRPPPFLT